MSILSCNNTFRGFIPEHPRWATRWGSIWSKSSRNLGLELEYDYLQLGGLAIMNQRLLNKPLSPGQVEGFVEFKIELIPEEYRVWFDQYDDIYRELGRWKRYDLDRWRR